MTKQSVSQSVRVVCSPTQMKPPRPTPKRRSKSATPRNFFYGAPVPQFKIIPAVYQQPAPFVPHQIMDNPVSPQRSYSPSTATTSRVQEVPAPPKSPVPIVSLNDMSMKSPSGSPAFLTQPSERTAGTFPINPPTMSHVVRVPVPIRMPMNQTARVPQVMNLEDMEVQRIAYGYRNTGVTSASLNAMRTESVASTGSLMNFTPSPRPLLGQRARPASIATNDPPARRGRNNNLLNF